MIFQAIVFDVIYLVFFAILFLIGVVLTRWLAKIQEYNENWMPAFILNAIWFGIIIGFWLLLSLIFGVAALFQIYFIFALPLNIIIGIIVAQLEQIYDIDTIKDAFKFVLINLILLFVILIIAFFVSIFIFALIV